MKVLKGIFFIIVGIIALLFIVALFLPSQYTVTRKIEVNKPIGEVYGYIADFNNFHSWNPWTPLEPNHMYTVNGDSGQIGQKYYWEGEVIGKGEMIFTELKQYEKIASEINFLAPQTASGIVNWNFNGTENTTNVSWSLTGPSDYPLGRYYGLMMDGFLGPSFEEGLKSLKTNCEK